MPGEKDLIIQGTRDEQQSVEKAEVIEFKAPIDLLTAKQSFERISDFRARREQDIEKEAQDLTNRNTQHSLKV